jgi:hypothetical protein
LKPRNASATMNVHPRSLGKEPFMAEKVTYAGSMAATGGPTVAFTFDQLVQGYEKFNVKVVKGTNVTVDLGTKGITVFALLVRSSKYGANLTFDSGGGAGPLVLDAPLVVGGTGAMKLLKAAGIESLTIDNKLTDDVIIDIFVARTPIP